MNEWISVKDKLPEKDCVCVVGNIHRPFQYHISIYNKYFNEFEINTLGSIRISEGITFNATHWMPLPAVPEE